MKKRQIVNIEGVAYTLESRLGQGGAAEVWRVRSSDGGHFFALKRIAKDPGASTRNERFRNEITYGLTANHPNVVKIHAHSEDDENFYYVMDLYSTTLREVIKAEFDYKVLLDYLLQLCAGLAHVHREGVVHRDIKPENILVDLENRRLVIADFGIARFKNSYLTKRGELLANRNYLAPEQMARKDPETIGKPSDIFALGLITAEMFTKQNSRGVRHRLVRDSYPFLSDVDLLTERMMLQDETQRIGIEAARDSLLAISRHVDSMLGDIAEEMRPDDSLTIGTLAKVELTLERAARDVLSAKYIFERTTDEELARFNPNHHCEIGYKVSTELFNTCVQAKLYSLCKAMFEYESGSSWSDSDHDLISTPTKPRLQSEFESILIEFPLAPNSIWEGLPSRAAHYFRFCKEYHCEELLDRIRQTISDHGAGSLRSNLLNAPLIWIAWGVRDYLKTDYLELNRSALQQLEFEKHVSVLWTETDPSDAQRTAAGVDLFDSSHNADDVARVLAAFEAKWDASFGERVDGTYSVHFRSRDEYERFRAEALDLASPYFLFEGDVLDLLRTEAEYDDLVALVWDRDFRILNTLAKVLRLREISETAHYPARTGDAPRRASESSVDVNGLIDWTIDDLGFDRRIQGNVSSV